jgi:hypothetical protein
MAPIMESDRFFAADANISSGIVVITPNPISSKSVAWLV